MVGPGGILEQAANKMDPKCTENLLSTAAELAVKKTGACPLWVGGVPPGVNKHECESSRGTPIEAVVCGA